MSTRTEKGRGLSEGGLALDRGVFPKGRAHLSDQDWSSHLILLNSLLQDPRHLAWPPSPGASLASPGPSHGGGRWSPGPPQLARLSGPRTPRELPGFSARGWGADGPPYLTGRARLRGAQPLPHPAEVSDGV